MTQVHVEQIFTKEVKVYVLLIFPASMKFTSLPPPPPASWEHLLFFQLDYAPSSFHPSDSSLNPLLYLSLPVKIILQIE